MSSQWTPTVVVAVGIAVLITVCSWYYSIFYQPKKIRRAYQKALYALAAAVETKDSGTIGHAERVASDAVVIAQEMGLPRSEWVRIEYAALLRDIGKVKVPAPLLNKATPLAADEWEIIQSHSAMGAEIAESVPFLAFLSDLIRHHHECWDGSGYPDGLIGDNIPLGSRILAVATDFDAITSDRPYHNPQPTEIAMEAICGGSGTKYDPRVVDAFVKVMETRGNKG